MAQPTISAREKVTDRLTELKARSPRPVIGLNCGTSLDGIDTALLRVEGAGAEARFTVESFFTAPLETPLRSALLRMLDLSVAELSELNVMIGEAFGAAAWSAMRTAGIARGEPCLIGSHGVTIFHRPPRGPGASGATLQLGEPAVIFERTGAVVISDFRPGDVAAGGQGAPLMPYLDHLLFHREPGTIVLNLGGIANLTWVGESPADVRALDTGPANLPLNHVMRRLSGGRRDFDSGGETAESGTVHDALLEELMAEPYILAAPPKTTGREEFGERWTESVIESHPDLALTDILATFGAFTARSVKFAVDRWLSDRPVRRVLVAGGGVHNRHVMRRLAEDFAPVPVEPFPRALIDPDGKEAVLFAMLANDRLFGLPTNIPSATGAVHPVSLGRVLF